jgi:release factor glutamine methyltransferase
VSHDVVTVLVEATLRLDAAGVPSARHDAEVLLGLVTGAPRARLHRQQPLDAATLTAYDDLVRRRERREPLQHITGRAAFRYLELDVGPGVFVPRPETEVMAGAAADELQRLVAAGIRHPVAVDLCTGSGAVAVAMASEVPASRVTGVELSVDAVAYARLNAAPHLVDIRHGDIADAVDDLAGQVHVVTANPPYIPLTAWESVEPEARAFDPDLSLWSGTDGLEAIRVVSGVAARLLVDGGLVTCEHADVQGESAPAVFAAAGSWATVRDNMDLSGRSRYVTARRSPRGLSHSSGTAGTICP